jgi:hypothetical protein
MSKICLAKGGRGSGKVSEAFVHNALTSCPPDHVGLDPSPDPRIIVT